jgi:AcrR family transcriptional regulator
VPTDARQRLLDAAVDHVARHGLTDLSLRQLAAELGTSHRMLSHHFGSKDGLWAAIVEEVERRQIDALAAIIPDDGIGLDDAMRAWWRHISDPALWPNERLFFEVYVRGWHNRSAGARTGGNIEPWIDAVEHLGAPMGIDPEDARAFARLGIAVTRGLLLDLLATEDRAAVDAAMEQWITLNARAMVAETRRGT